MKLVEIVNYLLYLNGIMVYIQKYKHQKLQDI
jgi:hypothetical protein